MKDKKYIILLGDGMSDLPLDSLGNKTPLEYANTHHMDALARESITGLAHTVPEGMHPGSDVANLSIFGYDPKVYYSGRAPLEALNLGIELSHKDVAFRCNIVTLENESMTDYSAGHIETPFTTAIIEELKKHNKYDFIEYYTGVSYRNIVVWRDFPFDAITETVPPHDISGQGYIDYLPKGNGSEILNEIMNTSVEIIRESNVLKECKDKHKGNPTSVWLWGGGTKPAIETLKERFGLYGHTISAVDLIHGIGRAAGLTPLYVQGVTGFIDTNYTGKAQALLEALKNVNYVYLHVESPDESGHMGNIEYKIKSIEDFDAYVVGPVLEGMKKFNHYSVLMMPDHPTPVSLKTHTSDPVPFCLYDTDLPNDQKKYAQNYSEKSASETGVVVKEGHKLLEYMVKGDFS